MRDASYASSTIQHPVGAAGWQAGPPAQLPTDFKPAEGAKDWYGCICASDMSSSRVMEALP